jgi:hypothetical protein
MNMCIDCWLYVPPGKKEVKAKKEQSVAVAVLELVGPTPAGTMRRRNDRVCMLSTLPAGILC